MGSIAGKTVLITGAGSGIGQAIAKRFQSDGAVVVGTDVNLEGLKGLDGLENVYTTKADVTNWDEVRASVAFAIEKTGRLDVYINNAGIAIESTIVDTDPSKFALLHAIHVNGTLHGMKAALEHMRKQGSGHIINVISRVAETATPGVSAYASAKAAMWSLTRIGAAENKDKGIVINAMFPGISRTAMTDKGQLGDVSKLGAPDQQYATFKMLATLDADSTDGLVWESEKVYPMFQADNSLGDLTGKLAAGKSGE